MRYFSKLLILLFISSGCNPLGLNLQNYQGVSDKEMSAINYPPGDTACADGKEIPIKLEDELWGGAVNCVNKCETNYKVLPKRDKSFGYLAFENLSDGFVGKCRGHAIVTQQFNMLGKFGKNTKALNCGPKNMTPECLVIYKDIIDDITGTKKDIDSKDDKASSKMKVREIPGFKNLQEFSSQAEIKKILKEKVMGWSHKYRAGAGHVQNKIDGKPMESFFHEVAARVQRNQMPYVGINGKNKLKLRAHAILVNGVQYVEGEKRLCVSDPNARASLKEADTCKRNYIYIVPNKDDEKAEGKLIYMRDGKEVELSEFGTLGDDDERTKAYVEAWQEECLIEQPEKVFCPSGESTTVETTTEK